MAVFTMVFKEVLELDPTIESGILTTYPIFDPAHRAVLNKKIIDHFWNHEIGQETISMFRLALARKLNEIMPLYNQQYEISGIQFNQLETVKISNTNTTTGETVSAGESTSQSGSGSKGRAVSQELPQTLLSGTGDYATNAQDTISDTTATGSGSDSSTVNQDGTVNSETTGFQGNAALMILQYRQSLVNVDMMIIDELKTLFMLIWSNGDEFIPHGYGLGYNGYGRFFY
jgi:hypothetical protein